ncbi:putative SOS response-associated peptidase YedK [Stenotrophomonas rhizophila]|uniref:SOS response-associated peptidase n=1 Tax=Stenotrophomonas TaxID=40323 RepID=UPI000F4C1FD2|nr:MULTISPECIES: SOS response-associated peptidase [Stenotrophomonas]MCW6027083.1 SOS response-associated peptidase [Stenotrophomonas sp. SRS1]ROP80577.1 putative SOS response-associated peptidase YedK [Stenotrophomonas rhizophila]
MRRFAQAIADTESLPDGLPESLARALVTAPDHYNIAKGGVAALIARDHDGTIVVADMMWGLVPRWSKEPATPYTTVTARLDRAPRSRIYAQAWAQRPCVLPMTGYYKWDRERRPPWPLFVQRKDGRALLAAGLWEHWENEDGQQLDSFTVLTGPNSAIPSPLTPDGPIFIAPATALDWLSGAFKTPAALRARTSTPALEAYPVSRAFRDPSRDDYTLLEPVDPDAAASIAEPQQWDGDGWDERDADE